MKHHNQHSAALEMAAQIDHFRKQFPTDADRLLEEYAGVGPTAKRDEQIAELESEVENLQAEIDELHATEGSDEEG